MADQLFTARQNQPPLAGRVEDVLSTDDPTRAFTPANRRDELFSTIGEELRDSMMISPHDMQRKHLLGNVTESLLAVMDEAGRPLAADEMGAHANVVRAYSDAYRSLPREQKVAIQSLAGPRGADIELFFGQNVPLQGPPRPGRAALIGPPIPQAETRTPAYRIPGLREARASLLDKVLEEADYEDNIVPRGYERTLDEQLYGRRQGRMFESLLNDYDIDPQDLMDTQFSDMAVSPQEFATARSRNEFPVQEQLGALLGYKDADNFRYDRKANPNSIGSEYLLDADGSAMQYQPGMVDEPGMVYGLRDVALERRSDGSFGPARDNFGAPVSITDNTATDRMVALQQGTKLRKIQDELHNRIWGFTSDIDDTTGQVTRVEKPFDLDYFAPWWRSRTDQNVGGVVKKAPLTAEQIADTILSQSGYAAEAPPYIRQLAKERLMPLVEEAMFRQSDGSRGPTYSRPAAGMRLLRDEGAVMPERRKPNADELKRITDEMRNMGEEPRPGGNDLGRNEPLLLPRIARETMPNRMLASLLS